MPPARAPSARTRTTRPATRCLSATSATPCRRATCRRCLPHSRASSSSSCCAPAAPSTALWSLTRSRRPPLATRHSRVLWCRPAIAGRCASSLAKTPLAGSATAAPCWTRAAAGCCPGRTAHSSWRRHSQGRRPLAAMVVAVVRPRVAGQPAAAVVAAPRGCERNSCCPRCVMSQSGESAAAGKGHARAGAMHGQPIMHTYIYTALMITMERLRVACHACHHSHVRLPPLHHSHHLHCTQIIHPPTAAASMRASVPWHCKQGTASKALHTQMHSQRGDARRRAGHMSGSSTRKHSSGGTCLAGGHMALVSIEGMMGKSGQLASTAACEPGWAVLCCSSIHGWLKTALSQVLCLVDCIFVVG